MAKKKLYLVLDTETATLPYAASMTAEDRKTIAISKPLVYDIGWQLIDAKGNVYSRKNFLIQETFFVPQIFQTAYYAEKRPLYMEMLERKEIVVVTWRKLEKFLYEDLLKCDCVAAYNAQFDFVKAIPYTIKYINHLYSSDFLEWEKKENERCQYIAKNPYRGKGKGNGIPQTFQLYDLSLPILDIWGAACERLLNNANYKEYCLDNKLFNPSMQYFRTTAETSYQFLSKNFDFIESHTALDDARIESELLVKMLNQHRKKVEPKIEVRPFRTLGTIFQFVTTNPRGKSTFPCVQSFCVSTSTKIAAIAKKILYIGAPLSNNLKLYLKCVNFKKKGSGQGIGRFLDFFSFWDLTRLKIHVKIRHTKK